MLTMKQRKQWTTNNLKNKKRKVLVKLLQKLAGIVAEARPVDDEARRRWRSGQNRSALQADKRFWEPQESRGAEPLIFFLMNNE